MKASGAKKQTVFLTGINAIVRAVGLLMRVVLSRVLGAEIMGIAELAQGVHMLAITPLTSGLPMAISRMTAKADECDKQMPVLAGVSLVRLASAVLVPLLLALSPLIARTMGDMRVLPSLWFTAPCILILGYSAVFNGYCYGQEWSRVPAISELIEQLARLVFSVLFIFTFHQATAPWLAALPVAATMLAEAIGLWFVLQIIRLPFDQVPAARDWRRPVLQLAVPTTVSRLIQTLLRSLTAILIPIQLQKSGLSPAESTARLGMLNGMVMPILMLPCIFTSALSMVALPRLSKAEEVPSELKRLLCLCFGASIPVALLCMAAVYVSAPLLANVVYRLAELSDLFRFCAPLTAMFALSHVIGGIVAALGQQKRSMYGALVASFVTLIMTCFLTDDPRIRVNGVVCAQAAGQLISIFWGLGVIILWRKERRQAR